MKIFNYDFFKKKQDEIKTKSILSDEEKFDAEKFNDWFCNIYDGYDGRKGNKGIFLRLDKLSPHMIEDWFNYLNVDYSYDDEHKMIELIRNNWIEKREKL